MVFLLTCLPFSCLCNQTAIFLYLLLPSRSHVGDRAGRKTLRKALASKKSHSTLSLALEQVIRIEQPLYKTTTISPRPDRWQWKRAGPVMKRASHTPGSHMHSALHPCVVTSRWHAFDWANYFLICEIEYNTHPSGMVVQNKGDPKMNGTVLCKL